MGDDNDPVLVNWERTGADELTPQGVSSGPREPMSSTTVAMRIAPDRSMPLRRDTES
jgi:hypothetical protein